jgi:hypothetical protein
MTISVPDPVTAPDSMESLLRAVPLDLSERVTLVGVYVRAAQLSIDKAKAASPPELKAAALRESGVYMAMAVTFLGDLP